MPELNNTILKNNTNLKAYYRFESGAETTDSSGNSHTLTAIATPTFSAGKFGQGVDYASASSQAHSAVQHADLQPTAIFSAGMWFKSSTAAIQGMFQSYTEATSKVSGWDIHLLADGSFECLLGNNTGITLNTHYTKVVSGTGFADGNWHHMVLIWNKPTAQLYIDGKYIASSGSFNNDLAYSASTVVRVGCRCVDGSTNLQFFNGSLDDVFLVNGTALSADQIKELYEGRYVGEGWPQAGLVAGYHLSSTTDYSGNNYHLTNNNSCTFTPFLFGNGLNLASNTNKWLSIADDFGINGGLVTMSLWCKLDAFPSAGNVYIPIYIADDGTDTAFQIVFLNNSGTRQIAFHRVRNGVAQEGVAYFNYDPGTTLHNFVLTYDNTNVRAYIDGSLRATGAASGNGSAALTQATGIGASPSGGNTSGYIDEVQIYNVAKDANWVRKQYAWAKGMFL